MRRRDLMLGLGTILAFLRAPSSLAQAGTKPFVIARLHPGSASDPAQSQFEQTFRDGMSAFGYRDGQAYALETRYAEGRIADLPALASDLVRMKADLIIAVGVAATRAAKAATAETPIVMAMLGPDPVALGLVASLTRPGGNVTGFTGLTDELSTKQLELLREMIPGLTDVVVLFNRGATQPGATMIDAARTLSVRLQPVTVAELGDIDRIFAELARPATTGVIIMPDAALMDRARGTIAERALRHRLATAGSFRISAEAGMLLSYAVDLADMHRRSAGLVHRIMSGTKPADMPVEQLTKFEMVINLKTARALGLHIPASIIARADEVIE
jgi:putative tryptophan/tyrosine transport system substrate-binding protein